MRPSLCPPLELAQSYRWCPQSSCVLLVLCWHGTTSRTGLIERQSAGLVWEAGTQFTEGFWSQQQQSYKPYRELEDLFFIWQHNMTDSERILHCSFLFLLITNLNFTFWILLVCLLFAVFAFRTNQANSKIQCHFFTTVARNVKHQEHFLNSQPQYVYLPMLMGSLTEMWLAWEKKTADVFPTRNKNTANS